jgi:dihydroflavonol-4-reductase
VEFVALNPGFIQGPPLVSNSDFTSGQVLSMLMLGKYPGMPKVMFPIVDVRDIAHAHLLSIKIEDAKNQRFIISAEDLWFT